MADDAYVDPNFNPVGDPIGVYPSRSEVQQQYGHTDPQANYIANQSWASRKLYPESSKAYRNAQNTGVTPVNLLDQWEQDITPEEGNQGGVQGLPEWIGTW